MRSHDEIRALIRHYEAEAEAAPDPVVRDTIECLADLARWTIGEHPRAPEPWLRDAGDAQ